MSSPFGGEQADQSRQHVAGESNHPSHVPGHPADRAEGLPFEGEHVWEEWIDIGGEG